MEHVPEIFDGGHRICLGPYRQKNQHSNFAAREFSRQKGKPQHQNPCEGKVTERVRIQVLHEGKNSFPNRSHWLRQIAVQPAFHPFWYICVAIPTIYMQSTQWERFIWTPGGRG
jgi:hypothetical protein